jgi:hypothetical protein
MDKIQPFVVMDEGLVYFVLDGVTGKYHLTLEPYGDNDSSALISYLCGINGTSKSEIVVNDQAFAGLLGTTNPQKPYDLGRRFQSSAICGNCRAVLVSRLWKKGIKINDVITVRCEERRQELQRGQTLQQHGVLTSSNRPVFKTLLEAFAPSEDSMTTEIIVGLKITFDLADVCPADIISAVEEIRQKATEYGEVGEITLTSDGSLNVNVEV